MKTVLIIIGAIVLLNVAIAAVFFLLKRKKSENSTSKPVEKPEPTTEPVKPVEPKFKVGDWIVYTGYLLKDSGKEIYVMQVASIEDDRYNFTDTSTLCFDSEKDMRSWTIQDARNGDVLVSKAMVKKDIDICIFKCFSDIKNSFTAYCSFVGSLNEFDSREIPNWNKDFFIPATKEQRDILFAKMSEAGYTWDAETKTLSKIEESAPEPEPVGTEEPDIVKKFNEIVDYFSQVVPIGEKTKEYFWNAKVTLYQSEYFPTVYDYYGDKENEYDLLQLWAWFFGMTLAELVPEKRDILYQMAYDYKVKGAEQPTYGWDFETDPNIARMRAAASYATTRNPELIPELRKEVGGKMLTYKNDISECYIDCTKFMPTAPAPYLSAYSKRPEGTPVDGENTAYIDEQIHDYISQYYSLDTKDKENRRRTIQAISDKEYKKPHLFGKPRTVKDDKYGTMTFNPVFGKHNIGIEIPDDGVIAEMCYKLGKPCSHTRETLLNQEYGRRRPGEGETDGKANTDPKQRVLVNYAIEEGDGRSTGYYNKNGQYVDNNGVSIGDYETYFQNQVYANSYPSGHSAYIMGVGLILMMIMPEKADKILRAVNEYANSRMICRFHWQSDTIHGRVIGTMMVPVLAATTNVDFDNLLKKAKAEYERILSGDVTPEPTPTEKVNTSLAYNIGGYGSCHVDAGEKEIIHCCTKQCTKERHPSITVNQQVEFTIEGGGVTTDDGKTSGVWEANKPYGIKCPAVTEDKYAYITMRNENGVRVLKYRCSKDGTHDDGCNNY